MMSSRVNNSDGTDDNEAAAAAAATTAAAELVERMQSMLLDKNGSAIIKLKLENKTLKKKLISHQQYISENENLKLEIKELKAALAYAVAIKATNEADDDSNRDGVAVLTLLGLPIHLRVTILNFLGQTQDELRTLTIISKQFYKECNQPGIKWKIIPTIIIRPKQHQKDDSIRGRLLLQTLSRQETMLRRYSHMIIYDVHKFSIPGGTIGFRNYITLDWILSLDFLTSSPPPPIQNGRKNCGPVFFIRNCPSLEKFTYNNMRDRSLESVDLGGFGMTHCNNLKEIQMNDSLIGNYFPENVMDNMSNLTNPAHSNQFIFHKCSSKILERVLIRNAKFDHAVIPQNALIKFVRMVPSLRLFQSDLTQDNIDMLVKERPDIEFMN